MRASYCNLAAVDDHAMRKSLAFLLTLTGNQVAADALADEFLQRGDLNRVSGLILDHRMAHVTGLELTARRRAGGCGCLFCWSPVCHRLPSPPGPRSLALQTCWKNIRRGRHHGLYRRAWWLSCKSTGVRVRHEADE
jgi:hypothetical protein